MKDKNSRYEKINWWIRNNKITVALIFLGTVTISLSTFTNAAKDLFDLFQTEKRPDINGIWSAEVTYDWASADYTETFVFEGEGEELHGTATFLKAKHVIYEGSLKNNRLEFITKTKEISSSWNSGDSKESTHRYSGKITDDGIQFIMQTEGGYSLHTAIEFTAKKVTVTNK